MQDHNESKERQELMQELDTLLMCYQVASDDDKAVVWAVLNKYAPLVADL